ncbi:hypothetical protein Tco_1069128, partial [Tanacetum coccineum]
MAANQAIEYAPQCGDLTVESLTFHNNNVVGYRWELILYWASEFNSPALCLLSPHMDKMLLGPDYTQDESFGSSPTILSPDSGPYADQKWKKLSPKTPAETKVTPPPSQWRYLSNPTQSPRAPYLIPKNAERNIQLWPRGDKDSEGLKPPADMEPKTTLVVDPSGTDAKYQADQTQSARLRYRSLTENKGKTSFKVEPDTQTLQLNTFADIQAFLLSEDELTQESDDDVLEAREDMDEDTQADEEEHQSPPDIDKPKQTHAQETQESDSDSFSHELKKYVNILPLTERQLVKYLRKVSQVLFNRLTEDQWEKHEEAVISYADLWASIEGYYEENVDHKEQSDKLVQETMDCLDKNSTDRAKLLKALNE